MICWLARHELARMNGHYDDLSRKHIALYHEWEAARKHIESAEFFAKESERKEKEIQRLTECVYDLQLALGVARIPLAKKLKERTEAFLVRRGKSPF